MKILTGLLHTPEGEAALERAVEEARIREAQLLLVSYVPTAHEGHGSQEFARKRAQALEEADAEAVAFRRHGIEVSVHVPTSASSPSAAILQTAADERVDLIVIGIRRRSRVGKLVLGSNAQEILLQADAPVLAVRPPDDD